MQKELIKIDFFTLSTFGLRHISECANVELYSTNANYLKYSNFKGFLTI